MLISDWSSDVCSSDLHQIKGADRETEIQFRCLRKTDHFARHTTTKQNVAFQRAHAPHHAFDQRGFARTVGADDRGQRARCEDAAGITYGNVLTPPQPDTLQFAGALMRYHHCRAHPVKAHKNKTASRATNTHLLKPKTPP